MEQFEMLWEELKNIEASFELESDDKRYIDFEKVILPRTKKYKYEHPCYDNKLGYYLKEETYSISEMRLLFIEATEFKIIIGIETYIELSSFGSLYKFKLTDGSKFKIGDFSEFGICDFDIFDIYVWFEIFRLPAMFLTDVAKLYYSYSYEMDIECVQEKHEVVIEKTINPIKSKSKTYIMKDSNTGLYKIGKSINPKYREKTLQCEKPTISMIKIFESDIEKHLHENYSKHRVRGEWFDLNAIQLRYICTHYN